MLTLLQSLHYMHKQVAHVDLLDKGSVRRFAVDYKGKHKHLDIFVGNAGAIDPGLTETGHSRTFTTDYLGHSFLIFELYDMIESTHDSRVVLASSVMHHYAKTDWKAAADGM